MKTFKEYSDDKNYNDLKLMVINALDPQGKILDPESSGLVDQKLADFKSREELLTSPNLSAIINKHANRGAILQAIQSDTATIGNLLSLLTQDD